MNRCDEYEPLIHLYLDELLEPSEAEALRAHLKECPACREKLEQFESMKAALSDLDEPIPEGLHASIMARVNVERETAPQPFSEKRPIRFPRSAWKALAGVAACALIAFTALRISPVFAPKGAAAPMAPAAVNSSLKAADSSAVVSADGNNSNTDLWSASLYAVPGEAAAEDMIAPSLKSADLGDPESPPCAANEVETFSAALPQSVRKWYLGVGKKQNLPEWIDYDALLTDEEDGEALEFAEFDPSEETIWVSALTKAGFDVTEITDRGTVSDGKYMVMLFEWKE